jgi:hypothetical protein
VCTCVNVTETWERLAWIGGRRPKKSPPPKRKKKSRGGRRWGREVGRCRALRWGGGGGRGTTTADPQKLVCVPQLLLRCQRYRAGGGGGRSDVCVCVRAVNTVGRQQPIYLRGKERQRLPAVDNKERRRVARINFLISFFAGDEDNPSINELITYSFLSLAIVWASPSGMDYSIGEKPVTSFLLLAWMKSGDVPAVFKHQQTTIISHSDGVLSFVCAWCP